MSRETYYHKMRPYAERASRALDMNVDFILIQWAHESANGTSAIAKENKNHAGIKWSKYNQVGATINRGHAKYNSLDRFVTDYIRVMNLSYYDKVRQALSIEDEIKAIDASPYAEDKKYGQKLLAIFNGGGIPSDNGEGFSNKELATATSIGLAFIALMKLVNQNEK
jgi:flagellum-specific peptidoglycan hydrolase FlgJ